MTSHFVLGFGGTGARCVESLTYLLAARAIKEPCHVLIVDPDQGNGNVESARRQLQRYAAIQRTLRGGSGKELPFFGTPLNGGKDSFFWANPSGGTDWSATIGYQTLEERERLLMELLYDEDDLDLTFEKGYIGRAHIGSLDLLRTLRRGMRSAAAREDAPREPDALIEFARALRAAVQSGEQASLLIVGSIFGGTGASGLPALPPLLRDVLGDELRRRLAVACVQVAPYFTFPRGGSGDPDSAVHPLATQTALRHYGVHDVGYDRIYLVGAPQRSETAESNRPGGAQQRNLAHHVEIAAALAAAHLFAQPPKVRGGGGAGELLVSTARKLGWDELPGHADVALRPNLVALATFCAAHARVFGPHLADGHHVGRPWHRMLERRDVRLGGQESALGDLNEFSDRYLAWIRELQKHTGQRFFTVDQDLQDASIARVTDGASGRLSAPASWLLKEIDKERDPLQESGVGSYVHLLTQLSDRFCGENYPSWMRRA